MGRSRGRGGKGARRAALVLCPLLLAAAGDPGRPRSPAGHTAGLDVQAPTGPATPPGLLPLLRPLAAAKPRARASVRVPPPAPRRLPAVSGTPGRPLVVIDAGHGGVDPGATGVGGLREKDLSLAIARSVRDALVAGGRLRAALTRDGDRFLPLRERFAVARRLKADLFVSVHCDSLGAPGASGASVYTLSEVASDREAARLARRENRADAVAGVDLGDADADVNSILIDLTQRETMNASAAFARLLGREAKGRMPVRATFHRMASLMVLRAPDLPSVLFETGYVSDPGDAAFLNSAAGRAALAGAVRRAAEAFFARRSVAAAGR